MYESAFNGIVAKKGRSLPTYEEVKSNISLILYNSHVSLGANIRSPLNYIPIGGYHVDTNATTLPKVNELPSSGTPNMVYNDEVNCKINRCKGFNLDRYSSLLGFAENNG